MASSKPSIKVVKSFAFKGGTQVWSNRYYFSGGTPSSDANWHAFMDAVVNLEKTIYTPATTIISCVGYAAGSDVPVSSKTYSQAGTMTTGTGVHAPGECVALGRWSTSARSSKNHPIYAFSYWHDVSMKAGSGNQDTVDPTQRGFMQVYAAGWVSGITAGGITAIRSTPSGHDVNGYIVEEYITHRDFPPSSSV